MQQHLKALFVLTLLLGSSIVAWQLLIPVRADSYPPTPDVLRQGFTVQFDDFQAQGEITYPVGSAAPYPVVIMIAGSGPADMDVSIPDASGQLSMRLFRDISDALTRQGYATARYNKRHVRSATDHPDEREYPRQVTPQQLQGDFDQVFALVAAQPQIDRSRVAVYGWSEGTMIATQAALDHPEIAALVLHAPLSGTYRDVDYYQLVTLGVPFLREVVDVNRDGALTIAELTQVSRDEISMSLQGLLALLVDDPWFARPRLPRTLDIDQNGKLDLTTELSPALALYFSSWDDRYRAGGLGAYTTNAQPPPLLERLPCYPGPVLLLHGEADGNIPATDSRQLAAALIVAQRAPTLRLYPSLGHTLGQADGPYRDTYAPIRPEVLRDLGGWLDEQLR